jgi:drug/metabolite transporter (DMT)-like permease
VSAPIGELAALGAATCWAFTSLLFTLAGRRVGSQVVNLSRLLLAAVILILAHRAFYGTWLPLDAGLDRWGWLAVSGLIGLALGDAALFQSLIYLGPRLGALLMALAPIIATLAAWLLLGERLSWVDGLAIALTVGGVGWVVGEQSRGAATAAAAADRRQFALGVGLGVAAATGQALGLITSRLGMHGDYPVLPATVMRMLAGGVAVWLAAAVTGRAAEPLRALRRDGRAALAIGVATAIGPVAGVSLSLVAIQHAPVGIASTLMALTPVLVLPLVWALYRERISPRALAGTVVALAGVGLIFLV